MLFIMNDNDKNKISRALVLAPFVFILHFLEEAPGFVKWFNAHVNPGITSESFWAVNLAGLIITSVVVGIGTMAPSSPSYLLTAAWLSLLMPANALIHIAGSVIEKDYVPGVITAIALYLPYYFWLMTKIKKSGWVSSNSLIVAAVIGAAPMLVHGYRILFLGSRLF